MTMQPVGSELGYPHRWTKSTKPTQDGVPDEADFDPEDRPRVIPAIMPASVPPISGENAIHAQQHVIGRVPDGRIPYRTMPPLTRITELLEDALSENDPEPMGM